MATHDFPSSGSGDIAISGTPTVGQVAKWLDATTLVGAALVNSDLPTAISRSTLTASGLVQGANLKLTATGPGVLQQASAGAQITVGAVAQSDVTNLVSDLAGKAPLNSKLLQVNLSHGTYSSGELITTGLLASGGAADGDYEMTIRRRGTGGISLQVYFLSFRISSNAVSGTPVVSWNGPSVASTVRVDVNGSNLVTIHLNQTSAADFYIELRTQATIPSTAWSVSDAAATGTVASSQNNFATIAATTLDHSGAITMSGSPASAGASVRNRHGNGGTTDTYENVPTGGAFGWTINGTEFLSVASGGTTVTGDVICSSSAPVLRSNTSDGSDTKSVLLNGGGAGSDTRGGGLYCYGNEHATLAGVCSLNAGNVTGAYAQISSGGTSRLKVNHDGSATVDPTFGASLATALGVGWTTVSKSADETITSDSTLSDDATLKFSVAANTKYRFRFSVYFRSGATPDFKYALTGPSSPTLLAARVSRSPAFGSVYNYRPFGTYAEVAESLGGTPGSSTQEGGYVLIEGVLHNGANAGTVAFQWAQDTSDASNTTVLAGSTLEWKQV